MREVVFNKGKKEVRLMLYDDIDQMPIERFNKTNKFWMMHDSIGSSFADIDNNHLAKLYLLKGDPDKLTKQLDNLRILIHSVINEVNVSHMAFGSLVFSVNGEEVADYSDEGISRLLTDLSEKGLTEDILKKNSFRVDRRFMRT